MKKLSRSRDWELSQLGLLGGMMAFFLNPRKWGLKSTLLTSKGNAPLVAGDMETSKWLRLRTHRIPLPTHAFFCFLLYNGYCKKVSRRDGRLDLKDIVTKSQSQSKVCVYAYISFSTGPGALMIPKLRVYVICGMWCFQHSPFLGRFCFHWGATWNSDKHTGLISRGVDSCLLLPCFYCEFLSILSLWLFSYKRERKDFILFALQQL